MEQDEARQTIMSLENLSKFAKDSGIPRRTLLDLKAGKGTTRRTTLMLLDQALKRIKPKRKD